MTNTSNRVPFSIDLLQPVDTYTKHYYVYFKIQQLIILIRPVIYGSPTHNIYMSNKIQAQCPSITVPIETGRYFR